MTTQPYTCVCCGRKTMYKNDMRRHLYNRKSPCPMSVNPIEMTDAIREYILANRVYHIPPPEPKPQPPPPAPTIYQTIHANNTVNNMIVGMPTQEKMEKYVAFTGRQMNNVYASMDERFQQRARAFQESRPEGMQLRTDDIMGMINEATSPADVQDMNIMYEPRYDRLKLYENGKWREELLKSGCKHLLRYLQETLLDDYEWYLIKRMYQSPTASQARAKTKELLCDYYRFLGTFDIEPYVQDRPDSELVPHPPSRQETYDVQDELMELYTKTTGAMTRAQMTAMQREVVDIIKKNSRRNLDDLNQKIAGLFHMDTEFQRILTERRRLDDTETTRSQE